MSRRRRRPYLARTTTLHTRRQRRSYVMTQRETVEPTSHRLIGITKSTIKKVLGQALVSYETLHTIVTEIEGVMNDRPLTYVTSDASDQEPLTPATYFMVDVSHHQEDVPVPHVTTQTDVTK